MLKEYRNRDSHLHIRIDCDDLDRLRKASSVDRCKTLSEWVRQTLFARVGELESSLDAKPRRKRA